MILTSKANNHYYLDYGKKSLLLLHPKLKEQIQEEGNNGETNNNQDDYYSRKYALLKENGYFTQKQNNSEVFHYSSEDIKKAVANSTHVVFEVTERCNLKCKYCGYGEYYETHGDRFNKEMTFEKAKLLLDYLYQYWNSPDNLSYGKKIIISFYGGEPLLNFHLIQQVVNYSQQLNLKKNTFTYSITTNGTLLNKYIDFLYNWDFSLFVSLDGSYKHNAYRVYKNGKESFSKIYTNLLKIREKYPLYFEKNIQFNSVFHKKSSLLEVSSFLKSKFDKSAQFLMLNTFGIKEEKKEKFKKIYKNPSLALDEESECTPEIKDQFSPIRSKLFTFMQYHCNNLFYEFNELRYPFKQLLPLTGTCIPFQRKIYLRPNGTILPCEKVSPDFTMGKVADTGVLIDFDKIALFYNQLFDDIYEKQCRKCENYFCKSCIFTMKVNDDRVFQCEKFKASKGFLNYIQELVDESEESSNIVYELSQNFKTLDL